MVELTVGYFRYPDFAIPSAFSNARVDLARQRPALLAPGELELVMPEELTVEVGGQLHCDVLVRNPHQEQIGIVIRPTGAVVDSEKGGRQVGGYPGPNGVRSFRDELGPGESLSVQVLVGSASLAPEVGYALPPGQWNLELDFKIDGRERRSPTWDLRIIPPGRGR